MEWLSSQHLTLPLASPHPTMSLLVVLVCTVFSWWGSSPVTQWDQSMSMLEVIQTHGFVAKLTAQN